MRACLLSSLLLCSSCYRWTPGDAALLASGEAATILDWDQTRTSIGPNCMETNPIIGSCACRSVPSVYVETIAVAVTGKSCGGAAPVSALSILMMPT